MSSPQRNKLNYTLLFTRKLPGVSIKSAKVVHILRYYQPGKIPGIHVNR